MADALTKLKTDASLIQALEKAASHKPSAAEIFEQKVSFIYGSIKDDTGVTRERIKQILDERGATQQ